MLSDEFHALSKQPITLRVGGHVVTLEFSRAVNVKVTGARRAAERKAVRPVMMTINEQPTNKPAAE